MSAYLKVYFPSTKQRRNNTALASYRFPGEGGWGGEGWALIRGCVLIDFSWPSGWKFIQGWALRINTVCLGGLITEGACM